MIVVFGGAFNPPTLAHFKAAETVINRFDVERFIFLPVGNNYDHKEIDDYTHRINMLQIVADKLGAEVSLVEIESDKYLGTYESLKKIGYTNIKFLLGSDNLSQMHLWRNKEKLMTEFEFIVLSREQSVNDIISNSEFLSKYQDKFTIISDFDYPISSSSYKETHNDSLLLKEVTEYIEIHGLYRR